MSGTWNTFNKLFAGWNPRGGPYQGWFYGSEDIPTVQGAYDFATTSTNEVAAPTEVGTFGRWESSWKTVWFECILTPGQNQTNEVIFSSFQ